MDTKHDDGGPRKDATLWDEYAKAALQGELASQSEKGDGVWTAKHAPALAALCAEYADAMLAERRKRGIGQ